MSNIGLIETKAATIAFVATLILIFGAIFLSSSDSTKHKIGWTLNNKLFSALAINTSNTNVANESAKTDTDNNNNSFANSLHIVSPYIKEYSMPKGTWPNGILVAKDGMVWIVGTKSQTLISFDPKHGKIVSEYPIKKEGYGTNNKSKPILSAPTYQSTKKIPMITWAIVEDNKDRSIWFSQADSPNPLWHFDLSTKRFHVIENISGAPYQMKVDNKTGDIWFTTYTDNKLGVIQKTENKKSTTPTIAGNDDTINNNATHYAVKEFELGKQSFPSGFYLDSANSLWITQSLNDKLVHFKVIRDGSSGRVTNITKLSEIPSSSSISMNTKKLFEGPYDIVARGTDLWITEHDANFLTKYNTKFHTVTKFPTSSNPHQYLSLPFWLRETQDGHGLWFNEHYGNRIAFFNTADSTLTEYEVPTRNQSLGYIANALNIAVDPSDSNNKLWFSEYNHDKIGVVDRTVPILFNIDSSINKKVVFNYAATTTTISSSIGPQNQRQEQNKPSLTVDFEITKNNNNNSIPTNPSLSSTISNNTINNEKIVFFKASSSLSQYGLVIGNATFSADSVDLTKIKQRTHVQLLLTPDSEFTSSGSALKSYVGKRYTLGISAANGPVTKSIFLGLFIK
jgi:streptogramin lyase